MQAVVTGIVGCAGLLPTVAAIKAKKDICLANKETLIAGACMAPHCVPQITCPLPCGLASCVRRGTASCCGCRWVRMHTCTQVGRA